ncbi:suppressor of fused domain protein [Kribbella sp. NPDC026596]|uniref:suppressor of fused domain protein n=1 Tax=Kribbella sp. NPDC026596 TaxID=3155122 RepID=UPI0033DA2CC9
MTKAEYLARAEAEDDWAPGWLAIDAAFDALYPGITPPHLGAALHARAIFGGEEYIDGYSIFPSPNGYQHLLTYGMSKLYVDEESFGGEFSGWGYEMTMKVRANGPDECRWAVNSLSNLGRYTYTSERWFEPFQFISGRGQPLQTESGTLLTSYVMVPDTEARGIDTVHGRVDFIQLVGSHNLKWTGLQASLEKVPPSGQRTWCDASPKTETPISSRIFPALLATSDRCPLIGVTARIAATC